MNPDCLIVDAFWLDFDSDWRLDEELKYLEQDFKQNWKYSSDNLKTKVLSVHTTPSGSL